MIAGLPVATWVLMVVSVVPGIVLVVMAHRAHRGDVGDAVGRAGDPAGATPPDGRPAPRSPGDA